MAYLLNSRLTPNGVMRPQLLVRPVRSAKTPVFRSPPTLHTNLSS